MQCFITTELSNLNYVIIHPGCEEGKFKQKNQAFPPIFRWILSEYLFVQVQVSYNLFHVFA